MGVTVALAVLSPNTRILFLFIPLTLRTVGIILVAIDLFGVLSGFRPGAVPDGTAHMVHLGGVAWGGLLAWKGWIWRDPLAELDARLEKRRTKVAVHDKERVDALLEKIHREGIQSLTRSEKAALKRASKRS
jgi:hypothetical protein